MGVENALVRGILRHVHNTGGWRTGKEKVPVAVFTYAAFGEALAYSNDGGAPLGRISIKAEGGGVTVESLDVYKMKSIWSATK